MWCRKCDQVLGYTQRQNEHVLFLFGEQGLNITYAIGTDLSQYALGSMCDHDLVGACVLFAV